MFGEFINAEPAPHLRADQVTNGISDLLAPPIGHRDGQCHRVVISCCLFCLANDGHRGHWQETEAACGFDPHASLVILKGFS